MSEIDVEVARYALRTFLISPVKGPVSVWVDGDHWKGGVCEARCLFSHPSRTLNTPLLRHWVPRTKQTQIHREASPAKGCSCGVYGALSLTALRSQYPCQAPYLVTVMAAEGKTIIGSIGLRTARARIVAYWCSQYWDLCERKFPDAKYFDDVMEMIKAFGIPEGGPTDVRNRCSYRQLAPDELP